MSAVYFELDKAIEMGEPIVIRLYAIIEATEKLLEYIVSKILNLYKRDDLIGAVYTSVKELAINGTKANLKRILFDEENIKIDNNLEYERGMALFRKKLNERFIKKYAAMGKKKGLKVEVIFKYSPKVFIIEIINNAAITAKEDKRIRNNFQKAIGYDDIAQFYMEAGDSTEGSGMGITLVTMLLKSSNLDPHGFTIYSDYAKKTCAKLEIPLSDEYQTSREKFKK